MSFYGSSFSFDGTSCEEYGLMMYDFNNTSQGDSKYASMKIEEDRIHGRTRSLFYGAYYDKPLEFTLVFGADEDSALNNEPIDRQEMEVIGSWLIGHEEYKWLTIDQPDMETLRYRCIITDLETIEVAMCKWAFKCTVHCDSPYAYTLPEVFEFVVDGSADVTLYSRSTANTWYYPRVSIKTDGSNDVSIYNKDFAKPFVMSFNGAKVDEIEVVGDTGVITGSFDNMYKYWNFVFPTLKRGDNHLTLTGSGTYTFTCEFPVNVGG